jgi:hypothetical protein
MGINSYTIVNRIEAAAAKTPRAHHIAFGAGGVPIALSQTDLWVTYVEVYGYKTVSATGAPVANSSIAHVGTAVALTDPVPVGGKIVLDLPLGTKFNLRDLYGLAANGDGLLIRYLE